VAIERHLHAKEYLTPAGGHMPSGFLDITDMDFTMKGTFVRELHDGKLRWSKRSIDWNGQHLDNMPACNMWSCNAGGHLELGETAGRVDTMTPAQQEQIIWHCKPEKHTGNCFRAMAGPPPSLPFPDIRRELDKLRYAHGSDEGYYSTVDRDGTRYSEMVEQRGNEKVSISAEPTEIVPNPSCQDPSCKNPNPHEATSQLTITATCDGHSLKDRQIGVRIDVMPRSGYHNHVDAKHPRPRGKLVGETEVDCGRSDTDALGFGPRGDSDDTPCIQVKTDPNGVAKVKFKSPLTGSVDHTKIGSGPYMIGIAGTYWISARDVQITTAPATTMILAKVKDLEQVKSGEKITVAGATSEHPEDFYGTKETLGKFTKLADKFREYQDKHNVALTGEYCKKKAWLPVVPVSMNDIALPDGGIFDLGKNWQPSHYTHSKGGGGDFNRFGDSNKTRTECGGTTANLQVWYMQVLVELGKDYGKWDCSDLGASGGYPMFSPDACAVGEIPTGESTTPLVMPGFQGPGAPTFLYFPPLLHLHVED
jgi:hypothetical protein